MEHEQRADGADAVGIPERRDDEHAQEDEGHVEEREDEHREQQHVLAALDLLAQLDAKQGAAHEERLAQGAAERAQGGAETAPGRPARRVRAHRWLSVARS